MKKREFPEGKPFDNPDSNPIENINKFIEANRKEHDLRLILDGEVFVDSNGFIDPVRIK